MRLTSSTAVLTKSVPPFARSRTIITFAFVEVRAVIVAIAIAVITITTPRMSNPLTSALDTRVTAVDSPTVTSAPEVSVLTPAIASIPAIPALPLLFPARTIIVPNAIGAIVTSVGAYTVTVPTFETSQGRSLFEVKYSFVTTRT